MKKTRRTKPEKIICLAVLLLVSSLPLASVADKEIRVVLGLGAFHAIEDNFGFEGFPFMFRLGIILVKGLTIEANAFGWGLYCDNLNADFFEFSDFYERYHFSPFVTGGLSMGIFGLTWINVGGGVKIRLYKRMAFRVEYRYLDINNSYKKTSLIAFRFLV